MALLVVLVGTLACGCAGEPDGEAAPSPAPEPANLAFVDVESSRAVLEQIPPAVTRYLSYDFRRLDEYAAQTMTDTTAKYWSEVEPSLEILREVAARRQVVSTAEVVGTSLDVLEPGRATLLLFVNRSTVEAGGPAQRETSGIVVTAVRVGPDWKIDGMRVL